VAFGEDHFGLGFFRSMSFWLSVNTGTEGSEPDSGLEVSKPVSRRRKTTHYGLGRMLRLLDAGHVRELWLSDFGSEPSLLYFVGSHGVKRIDFLAS
jgi:hypothetical protein